MENRFNEIAAFGTSSFELYRQQLDAYRSASGGAAEKPDSECDKPSAKTYRSVELPFAGYDSSAAPESTAENAIFEQECSAENPVKSADKSLSSDEDGSLKDLSVHSSSEAGDLDTEGAGTSTDQGWDEEIDGLHEKMEEPAEELPDSLIDGRYEVLSLLGKGAQGRVYCARNRETGKKAAIKQMRIQSLHNWKQYDLFKREAEILSELDVDGVAKFYEASEDLTGENPSSMIVQEYIEGRSLQSYLDEGRRFRFSDICEILIQLIDILKNIHHHHPPVIHRDVKPSNILLHYDNDRYSAVPKVFLIDFGAVANPQVQDGGSTVAGTYGYMAPEQLTGNPGPESDIYAFAALSVYLLGGTPPEQIETKDLRLLIDPYLESYPHVVTVLIRRMLEIDPAVRLCDYEMIRNSLVRFSKSDFDIQIKGGKARHKYLTKNVRALGQSGNIELWQDLPDIVPRKMDSVYERMMFDAHWELKQNYSIRSRGFDLSDFTPSGHACIHMLFVVSGILSVIYIPASIIFSKYIYSLNIAASAIIYIIILLIFVFLTLSMKRNFRELNHVYKYGRKTLATVESVKFFDNIMNLPNGGHILMTWKIVYSFNPPDDASPDSLHHVFYSFRPVRLECGDILPILYEIGTDPVTGEEKVFSMPYPLPANSSFFQCGNMMSDEFVKVYAKDV